MKTFRTSPHTPVILSEAGHRLTVTRAVQGPAAARPSARSSSSAARYGYFEQDTRVPWFKDPDGNTLSISQHPK